MKLEIINKKVKSTVVSDKRMGEDMIPEIYWVKGVVFKYWWYLFHAIADRYVATPFVIL